MQQSRFQENVGLYICFLLNQSYSLLHTFFLSVEDVRGFALDSLNFFNSFNILFRKINKFAPKWKIGENNVIYEHFDKPLSILQNK